MRNLVLIDFRAKESWKFCELLEEHTGKKWEEMCCISNTNHGSLFQNLIRYIKYFLFPIRVLFERKDISIVLAWQQFFGLIMAAYCRVLRLRKTPQIYIMTFIYQNKKSLWGGVYYRFIRYAVSSKYVSRIFVYSESERKYYSEIFNVSETLFVALNLGIEDERTRMEDKVHFGNYFVSAGRSNRDYAFLVGVWKERYGELRIICDSSKIEGNKQVTWLDACFGDDYLTQLAGSRAVIVPLRDEEISSGQLVVLHAMMFGKPVIITKNSAIEGYILDGETGLVIEKTDQALSDSILKLNNVELCREMSERARNRFESCYTIEALARGVSRYI